LDPKDLKKAQADTKKQLRLYSNEEKAKEEETEVGQQKQVR
jgi:hypothetical protein